MELPDRDLQLEHRTLPVNGIDLHAVFAGPPGGVPVLLLHGFPEFWYGWRHQIGPLAQAGYRVIAPDLRGYNLSSKPHGSEHYLPGPLQGDVLGLLDAVQAPQAHVIGHDWGGLIGWWLATAHPHRLRRLVILNAPHPRVFLKTVLRRPSQLLRSAYFAVFQLPHLPEFLLRQGNYRLLAEGLTRTSRPGTFTPAELERYREAWSRPGALGAMLSWYRAVPRYGTGPARDASVSVPTQIIWGERDVALSRTLAADSLARCSDGRLERLPDAGHWLHHEAPERVNNRVLEFLAEAV